MTTETPEQVLSRLELRLSDIREELVEYMSYTGDIQLLDEYEMLVIERHGLQAELYQAAEGGK